MTSINEVKGDLFTMAKSGDFDVITHGCNCFCKQGAGIALHMNKHFRTNDPNLYKLEATKHKGNHNKLGSIEARCYSVLFNQLNNTGKDLWVVNSYTQYNYINPKLHDTQGKPFDYEAFMLCMRKINHRFKGQHVGMPRIGCHLAGGVWERVREIIQQELKDCLVTVVTLD